jgi:hypothetical protein
MKKILLTLFLLCAVLGNAQNKKLAQTGMKFLNVATDPRAVSMGEALTSVEGNSSSLFFNPAGMARMTPAVQASFGSTQWIAGIDHMYGSAAVTTPNNDYGVFGVTVQTVDYGEIIRTIRASNAEGYMDVGTFSPVAFSAGLGYARSLSDRFSIGARVAYNFQDLGEGISTTTVGTNNPVASQNKVEVLSFDFGMLYKTGLKSLNFAVTIKNFSKEIKFQRENFQLPLTFRIGMSMNVMDLVSESDDADPLLVSVDAINSRDFPETVNMGAEYVFMKTFALRAGYMIGYDEKGFTAGIGVQQTIEGIGLGVDYAYSPFGVFGNVNRFALQVYF